MREHFRPTLFNLPVLPEGESIETKVNRMIRKFQIRYAILSNQIEICNDVNKIKKLIHAKNKISKAIESETSMEIYLFDLHNK